MVCGQTSNQSVEECTGGPQSHSCSRHLLFSKIRFIDDDWRLITLILYSSVIVGSACKSTSFPGSHFPQRGTRKTLVHHHHNSIVSINTTTTTTVLLSVPHYHRCHHLCCRHYYHHHSYIPIPPPLRIILPPPPPPLIFNTTTTLVLLPPQPHGWNLYNYDIP